MRVWAGAHAVDDFYQGLVPAAVPFFVLERDYSYLQASGLALAATLGSALPQLLFGLIADRHRVPWLAPLGIVLAGVGAGLTGLAPSYPAVCVLLILSGLGVAMFHPPAGRDARRAANGRTSAMGVFAVGGSVGFFTAPALVTPALDVLGLRATALFIPPAVLMAYVLLRHSACACRRGSGVRTAARRHRVLRGRGDAVRARRKHSRICVARPGVPHAAGGVERPRRRGHRAAVHRRRVISLFSLKCQPGAPRLPKPVPTDAPRVACGAPFPQESGMTTSQATVKALAALALVAGFAAAAGAQPAAVTAEWALQQKPKQPA